MAQQPGQAVRTLQGGGGTARPSSARSPLPRRQRAFPIEKGVLPTPEEEATAEEEEKEPERVTMKKSTHLTKKKLTVHLGEVLREARLKAELTQADVAERVGVVTEVYGRMERGNLTPSVLNLRKLCMVLRVDASAALGLEAGEAAAWLKESEPTSEESPPTAPPAPHLAPVGRQAALDCRLRRTSASCRPRPVSPRPRGGCRPSPAVCAGAPTAPVTIPGGCG